MTDLRAWIALSQVKDIGPVLGRRLLSSLGSPENIFRAGMSDLCAVKGITTERAEGIARFSGWDEVDRQLEAVAAGGMAVAVIDSPEYPSLLKEMPDAPVFLYLKGSLIEDDRYAIAVVGSRKNSHYGEAVTRRIAGDLAAAGFTVVSGMARGIDSVAHRAALDAGGRTIAVLGSGPDICYPPENRNLRERIISSGCIVSEFPPGTQPLRENFPRRNRIISGLTFGVLVVEATADSGSLITAQYALEQGREVFAVPGNITSAGSAGTNRLIQEGAKVVLRADDVVEELAPVLKGFIRRSAERQIDMTEEEHAICRILSREPKHVDSLTRDAGIPSGRLLGVLLSLELKGVARQSSGKRFYLS